MACISVGSRVCLIEFMQLLTVIFIPWDGVYESIKLPGVQGKSSWDYPGTQFHLIYYLHSEMALGRIN
jgi:hypothetical protein